MYMIHIRLGVEVRDGLMDGKHEVPALTGDTDLEFDHQDQELDLTVRLALSDLLPDANGEIVVMNEGDDPQVNIETDLRVLDSGVSPAHTTAGGIDVGGMQFWVFEDGTRLYYTPGLSISVSQDAV
jgi:hypothetical protein